MKQLSLVKDRTNVPLGSTPPEWFISNTNLVRSNGCVPQLFEAQVRRTPSAIAVELNGKCLTYQELNERANRWAYYLRGLGVGPDVLVGVSVETSFDLLVVIYGILKAGGAYVPLDPSYPPDRLRYMLTAVELPFLVTHSECAHQFGDLNGVNVALVDDCRALIDREDGSNPVPLATEDNLVYVIFTSGSTGRPKAAAVYHRGFSNLVQWFIDEFAIAAQDHALLVSSLSFDLTQKNLFATLIAGGTLHLHPQGPYDISMLSGLIRDRDITLINCTPSAFYPLVDPLEEASAASLASLRVVFLGGEPISIPRIKPWLSHRTCKVEIANTYGPTECTDICGFYRLTRDNLDNYDFVPLGRPIQNVQMAILDSEMAQCSIGDSGELCVGGAGVGAGYINDPKLTREKFVAHDLPEVTSSLLYRTGDQARWHSDGVIEFLGRLDHQVKIRGFRIELAEIERGVETHPEVSAGIVIVQTQTDGSDPQLACCITTNCETPLSLTGLRNHLAERLPAHMMPAIFEEFTKFPLSPNGKVDRKALGKLVRARHAPATTPKTTTDGGGIQEKIQAAWSQVLGRAQPGLDDNFFDLGGDSIRLARLHQLLVTLLEREFPITDLFANTTIRAMAQHFGGAMNGTEEHSSIRQRARLQREAQAARRRRRG